MADRLNVAARVCQIVRRLFAPLGVHVNPDTRLFMDLHLTDAKLLELRSEVEAEFDCTIDDVYLNGWATLQGAIETVERLKEPS